MQRHLQTKDVDSGLSAIGRPKWDKEWAFSDKHAIQDSSIFLGEIQATKLFTNTRLVLTLYHVDSTEGSPMKRSMVSSNVPPM